MKRVLTIGAVLLAVLATRIVFANPPQPNDSDACGDLSGAGKPDLASAAIALRIAVGLTTPTDAQKAAACGRPFDTALVTLILRTAAAYFTISSDINGMIQQKWADAIGLYFMDLNSGHWFGINENDLFRPSSMLKVPLMMTYFKDAESDHSLLQQEVMDTDFLQLNNLETYVPKNPIEYGKPYTIDDLIYHMIVYSDNSATDTLNRFDNYKEYKTFVSDFNIPSPIGDFMSPKQYAQILQTLYDGAYLNPVMTQKALTLLKQSDFPQGLPSGMPASIEVAHKYGENTVNGKEELHDCGIVYFPTCPYLVCIMTKGNDFLPLTKVIQALSKIVFDLHFCTTIPYHP